MLAPRRHQPPSSFHQCSSYLIVALLVLLTYSCGFIVTAAADESSHIYEMKDALYAYANKMGPFNNPLETYAYFELPMCPPASWDHKTPSLGEALAGDELYRMNISMTFGVATPKTSLCRLQLSAEDAAKLARMVSEQYWYQLYVDELPMWASLGKMIQGKPYIYTRQHFSLARNGARLVLANLTAEEEVPVPVGGGSIDFSYSVDWTTSGIEFDNRFRRYLDDSFFEHRIHWFSIFNSFMMVLFLVGLVVTILSRTVKADAAEFAKDGDEDWDDWKEGTGWKQVCLDVFRVPPNVTVLCALIGVGTQLVCLTFAIILIAIASVVYASRGALLNYAVLAYAVTSYIAGYVSGSLFLDYTLVGPAIGSRWFTCMMITGTAFPGFVMTSNFLLNFVAIAYDSAQAIPFGGMVVIVLLWICVSFPLVIFGTMMGRRRTESSRLQVPRVSQIPRVIPRRPWYLTREFFMLAGGVLPFGSIFIELYFVFTSFWNFKFYYVYGFMLLVFLILIIVTACVSIVCTYFLLNAEDHRWAWSSFVLSSSTALYVFLYAVYFYVYKTRMSGFFMMAFYFSYMSMFCVGIGIMCGSVGYAAASLFVRRIYRFVKID
eukprot:PhM_4_TR14837/c0_g1_i1/m.12118/K17087/TM9SF3; transmembrane 9 superfamily member 3